MKIHKRTKKSILLCEPNLIIPPLAFVLWNKRTSYFWKEVNCKKCLKKK